MSKDTIRRALAGRPARENDNDRGTGKVFVLTRDQVAAAFAAQRAIFDERGYHTFRYWRETTEGAAAVGDALLSALEETAPELFRALYAAAGEAEAEVNRS